MDEADIISRVAALETEVKSLRTQATTISELLVKVTEICTKLDSVIKSQEDTTQRLTALERQPADKWQTVTRTVITVAITAAVTWLVGKYLK